MAATLQPLSIVHAPLLAALHAESFGAECWSLDQIKGSLLLESTLGWGILQNNELAGFILLQQTLPEWEVITFCIRPNWRRHGYGKILLSHSLGVAEAAGAGVFLEVAEDNQPARKLYESLGFKLGTTRRNYYRRGNLTINAVCYFYHKT